MIEVDGVLVHEDVISEHFVCHLDKCKGACCVEGDAGAPLLPEEKEILNRIYPAVKKYMIKEGIRTVEEVGTTVLDAGGDLVTPCIGGDKACAYVIWENGTTKCAIEKAYEAGETGWRKPVSCHLYPIRVTHYPEFDALYYDRWSICSTACSYGSHLGVKVFEFLKDPLIRTYGRNWYEQLAKTARHYLTEKRP